MSSPPFLLLDSSIHAQIISQLEGGRHNYANKCDFSDFDV
jgi:hypothetical protein